ncbi:adhesion G-protein coupled receptor G2-like isoform X2 [Toxotes jaculatrix]|uniref:adhesion G-protein coupled receptor G2-like isoform X2 n=1 Tax=Toxotes jaculatrix TaxID=941984 RepID=UPI001B3A958F|nr:adhesion G-protein coupled receptor G2-like isoform X2 [Toxotes jaculatrix]
MLPVDVRCRWMFVVKTVILCYALFLKNNICGDRNETCSPKNILFVSTKEFNDTFPSEALYDEVSGIKLCFGVQGLKPPANCCRTDFNCSIDIKPNGNIIIPDKEIVSKQDIVLMEVRDLNFSCMPSTVYRKTDRALTEGDIFAECSFLLNIDNCLNTGNKSVRFSQGDFKESPYNEHLCQGLAETNYVIQNKGEEKKFVSCQVPQEKTIHLPPVERDDDGRISLKSAKETMNTLSSVLKLLGNSRTAAISAGNVKGLLTKLPPQNNGSITVGVTASHDMTILKNTVDSELNFYQLVYFPKEASHMAVERNGSFLGILHFPGMYQSQQNDSNSSFFNNEVLGIEMGTEISNLSETIDIHYINVNKNGKIASCRSWDGKTNTSIWVTDGCQTKETSGSIICQCSHLTFFAILLSPPGNISSSDFKSLTYITSVGCGLSMFFLGVALFMHCLIRKGKASHATKILMNLFVAMFTLNLSFLVNESIANLGNDGACVAMAAVMHYAMLATFSWFFMEALHLYCNLRQLHTDIKHYITKICIAGWVPPAVVVVTLLALKKYSSLVISIDDGTSAKMCWISDPDVHQGVNIGYYAGVFMFTLVIFIITVRQIVLMTHTAEKSQSNTSIKTKSFSIMGLLFLLGITWAFAFFSHGPLLLASYYIFTILNSFQGFFLFIYYYKSSKMIVKKDKNITVSSTNITTTNTVTSSTNPYGVYTVHAK